MRCRSDIGMVDKAEIVRRFLFKYIDCSGPDFTGIKSIQKCRLIDNASAGCIYDHNTIFVGSTASGVFMLQYDKETNEYTTRQFVSRGKESITNNNILNIYKDENKNLWILTQKGLNYLSAADIAQSSFANIQHFHVNISFTNAVAENEDYVLFGSQKHGIVSYHKASQSFKILNSENTPFIADNHITHIINTRQKQILLGIKNHAPILVNSTLTDFSTISFHCKNLFDVYIDRFNQAWLTGTDLGITRLNLKTKMFDAEGKYTIRVVSSEPDTYVIGPTCSVNFEIP